MSAIPLVLNAKCMNLDTGFQFKISVGAKEQEAHERIIKRDGNKCYFCQFTPSVQQEIHHLNHDHADNNPTNLVTACTLCHMAHHISNLGEFLNLAIVWLPEVSQANLNHLVRTLLVANDFLNTETNKSKHKDFQQIKNLIAKSLVWFNEEIEQRMKLANERIGTCSPRVLGSAMLSLSRDGDETQNNQLIGLRLLPDKIRKGASSKEIDEMISSWKTNNGPYSNLTPNSWLRLIKNCKIK